MKVLIVTQYYPPAVMGIQELLYQQISSGLKDNGHEILILTSDFREDEIPVNPGISRSLRLLSPFPDDPDEYPFEEIQEISTENLKKALEVLKSFEPDLMICINMERITLGPVFAAQSTQIPACFFFDNPYILRYMPVSPPKSWKNWFRGDPEKKKFPLAFFLNLESCHQAFISKTLMDHLDTANIPMQNSHQIRPGIQLHRFPFLPSDIHPDATVRLLYTGGMSSGCGIQTILRAVGKLARGGLKGISLSIAETANDDQIVNKLQKTIDKEDIVRNVTAFKVGNLDPWAPIYQSHHILIHSRVSFEAISFPVMEAMAAGCSVISTGVGGSGDLIKNKFTGLTYPPGNSDILTEKIWDLSHDSQSRLVQLHNARTFIERNCAFENFIDRMEDFLLMVSNRKHN